MFFLVLKSRIVLLNCDETIILKKSRKTGIELIVKMFYHYDSSKTLLFIKRLQFITQLLNCSYFVEFVNIFFEYLVSF